MDLTRSQDDTATADHNERYPVVVENVTKKFRIPYEKRRTVFEQVTGFFSGKRGYEDFVALNNVTFRVARGETLGVIGPNGSGKSTLMSLLAGIMRPDKGTIRVTGRIAPFIALGVGFEQDLTARENVFLYGTIMGLTKKEIGSRYDAIMEFADLKRFEEMKYQNLSSGMKMRLAFSTAIQTDPDVMLLDEVLAVGDEAFKIKCMEKIDDLREAGTTVILVTHSLDQVKEICDCAIFMDHGAVIEEGDPEKVVAHYIETVLGGQTVRERRRKTRRKKIQPPSPISQAGQERGTG